MRLDGGMECALEKKKRVRRVGIFVDDVAEFQKSLTELDGVFVGKLRDGVEFDSCVVVGVGSLKVLDE